MRLLSLSPVLALLVQSCNGPCQSLAERICSCEPNQAEEQGCLLEVSAAMGRVAPTIAEEEACEAILDDPDGCTCEALEREDFEACGLSRGE